ncbi:MAG: hypothetical protein J5985_07755, partial [Kiritimatiellae bacterium]|nr:hypothetical protein [Kiritimatiellia bacterium]
AAGRGFGEGIAFSSNWSAYFSHTDAMQTDSVSALAVSDSTLYLAGVLGSGYLSVYNMDINRATPLGAVNAPEGGWHTDAFAARISVSGGANVYPSYSLLEPDEKLVLNTFEAVSVSSRSFVCVGTYQTSDAIAEATVVRYDADSLDETWRFTLSCEANSAFHAVSIDPAGNVYAAGSTDCATNGFRPGGLVYKLDSADGGVVWSNVLGGGVSCRVNACAAPGGDALYLGGTATNGNGATVGFLKRLDASTGAEAYATTLAGPIAALAVAPDGALLLGGTGGALYKFADTGSGFTRLWATNLAASASITALAVDASNRVAVAGTATSAWFASTDGTVFNGPSSGFAVILPSDGNALLFAGWIGGDGETTADAIAFSDDVLAVGGRTKATDLASGGFCDTNWNYENSWAGDDYTCGYVKVWLGETFIPNPPGTLQVVLQPAGAVDAGAAWSVDGGATWLASGALADLTEGNYTVTFRDAEGYYTPESQSVTIESTQTNSLLVAYAAVPPPLIKRTINGTNVTLTVSLPEGVQFFIVTEVIPQGITASQSSFSYVYLPYTSLAGEIHTFTYTVTGEYGNYTLTGSILLGLSSGNEQYAIEGDTMVTIPDPSAVVLPPVPDITTFARTDAGWQLTFVSTQNVSYAVLTNATPVFGGAEYTTVEGADGTTTVTVRTQTPRLFFKILSR